MFSLLTVKIISKAFANNSCQTWVVCSFLVCPDRFCFKITALCISHPFPPKIASGLSTFMKTSTKVFLAPTAIAFSASLDSLYRRPRTWPVLSLLTNFWCWLHPCKSGVRPLQSEELLWIHTTVTVLRLWPSNYNMQEYPLERLCHVTCVIPICVVGLGLENRTIYYQNYCATFIVCYLLALFIYCILSYIPSAMKRRGRKEPLPL